MRWVKRLRPRTIDSYVGLYVAVFSTATQLTPILLIKDGFTNGISHLKLTATSFVYTSRIYSKKGY